MRQGGGSIGNPEKMQGMIQDQYGLKDIQSRNSSHKRAGAFISNEVMRNGDSKPSDKNFRTIMSDSKPDLRDSA